MRRWRAVRVTLQTNEPPDVRLTTVARVGRGDDGLDIMDAQAVARVEPLVVGRVGERQRQDGEVDQVGLVDALDGLGDDDADAQVHRAQRGVLAG